MAQQSAFASRRTLSLLVVLCLMVIGQWYGVTAERQHRSGEHSCLLCHAGPHATINTIVPLFRAPVFLPHWITPIVEDAAPALAFVSLASSRAPPAVLHW